MSDEHDLNERAQDAALEGMITGILADFPRWAAAINALNAEYARRRAEGEALILRDARWGPGGDHRGAYPWQSLHRFWRSLSEWYQTERARVSGAGGSDTP